MLQSLQLYSCDKRVEVEHIDNSVIFCVLQYIINTQLVDYIKGIVSVFLNIDDMTYKLIVTTIGVDSGQRKA